MLDQIVRCVLKRVGLELILLVDHHYGVLIMIVGLEARHTHHMFPNSKKLGLKGVGALTSFSPAKLEPVKICPSAALW